MLVDYVDTYLLVDYVDTCQYNIMLVDYVDRMLSYSMVTWIRGATHHEQHVRDERSREAIELQFYSFSSSVSFITHGATHHEQHGAVVGVVSLKFRVSLFMVRRTTSSMAPSVVWWSR